MILFYDYFSEEGYFSYRTFLCDNNRGSNDKNKSFKFSCRKTLVREFQLYFLENIFSLGSFDFDKWTSKRKFYIEYDDKIEDITGHVIKTLEKYNDDMFHKFMRINKFDYNILSNVYAFISCEKNNTSEYIKHSLSINKITEYYCYKKYILINQKEDIEFLKLIFDKECIII